MLSSICCLLALTVQHPPPSFEGSLLGVSAKVQLFESEHYANVVLRGLPVGGLLQGTAWFSEDGSVTLDTRFERALRVRLCKIHDVFADADRQHVEVVVRLPVFGKRSLVLQRVQPPSLAPL